MKNACKHFALCTLTLILCLALAACGSDNSGDSADYGNDSTVPSTIDGFVKESYDSYDYSTFEGYYLPDSGTDFDYLIIDTNGFALAHRQQRRPRRQRLFAVRRGL